MKYSRIVRRMCVTVVLVVSSGMVNQILAQVPISTAWPAPAVDVGTYTTVFECLSATTRVSSVAPESMMLRDTLPQDAEDVLAPLPPTVIETARRCGARYLADSVPLSEFREWMMLFLQAGRDNDANRLRERWLSDRATLDTAVLKRFETLQTLLSLYLGARPVRVAFVVPLVADIQRLDIAWDQRFQPAFDLFTVARTIGDSVLARQAAVWVTDITDHLSDAERDGRRYTDHQKKIMIVLRYLTGSEALDSLKKSTAAYLNLQRSLGQRARIQEAKLGDTAPLLEGDFWFPLKPTPVPPAIGRVTLVVLRSYDKRLNINAMLRRFRQRFPALDIVLAANTSGYFGWATPPKPAEEAEFFRQWLHEFYPVVSTLVVETTPFWRLPEPDRRRINEETKNSANYGDGVWIIDQTQTMIYSNAFTRSTEQEFAGIIEVLLTR